MESNVLPGLLGPLLLLGTPILGLLLGAALPPFLYGQRTALAIIMNVAGFLIYILPALFISLLICADNFKGPSTRGESVTTVGLALGIFAAVESTTFLLRRCLRRQRSITHHGS